MDVGKVAAVSGLLLVTVFINHVELGPTKREVYPEIEPEVCVVGDVVYAANDIIPAEQSCLRCRCHPPKVECETIICAKKTGCIAVHQPNKCCPDYQCECEHDGRIYGNGEKIQNSSQDCQVCYCRGGEVKCTEVTCYLRTDCQAKQVPGQCCPKYENCPEPGRAVQEASTQVLELVPSNPQLEEPRITIHEIIPDIKEIPITATSEQRNDDVHFNDLDDVDSEASEVLEVFHPPPILKIGDKLLFLHEGELIPENDTTTPTSVITIIGAEGLERGFEENVEDTPNAQLFSHSNELELKSSESTHILSLLRKKPEAGTTEVPTTKAHSSTVEVSEETSTVETSTVQTTLQTSTLLEEANTTLNVTEDYVEYITGTEAPSRESIEDSSEESGETMTETQELMATKDENASIASAETSEADDMTQTTSPSIKMNETTVEIFDTNATQTADPLPTKLIGKRENSVQDEADEVFKELAGELNIEGTERIQTEEEAREESERIFKELLEETSTPRTIKRGDKNAEMIDKITDAIARLTLRNKGGAPDLSILGLISNFFGAPRKK